MGLYLDISCWWWLVMSLLTCAWRASWHSWCLSQSQAFCFRRCCSRLRSPSSTIPPA
jgi:hypothetical protein